MHKFIKSTLFILTIGLVVMSCSHQKPQERSVAAQNCWDSVKGEYHSYFDSVEKCIEKEADK